MTEHTPKAVDVQIYGPSFSNFVRTIMLICEENHISYTTGFTLDGQTVPFKSAQHFALHPCGKFPILKDDNVVLPETASICRYLKATFDQDEINRFSVQQLARIDAFSALASIYLDQAIIRDYMLEFAFPKGENGTVRFDVVEQAQPALRKALKIVEDELLQGDILNGETLTVADALLAPMLHYVTTLPTGFNLLVEFPQLEKYFAQLMTRKSCQKVLVSK